MRISASRILIAIVLLAPSTDLLARDLTFAQRVEAQRAIERVYYIHRSGSERGFEAAVPESLLTEKVRSYLAESTALEEYWKTPVTAAMLRGEVARMMAGSRLPDRLRELRAALGDDDRLLAETLARATLVDRLCREFLAADTRVDTHDWDAWWATARLRFDPTHARTVIEEPTGGGTPFGWTPVAPSGPLAVSSVVSGSALSASAVDLPPGTPACVLQDLWSAGHDAIVPPASTAPIIWTGSEVIFWGVQTSGGIFLTTGRRYDPATDTWKPMTNTGAPSQRTGYTSVWNGREMIIWGGSAAGVRVNTGGRYDPAADAWTPTSTVNAPPPTSNHVAVWTGSLMIVWGGDSEVVTGGRYDPVSDTWTPTSMFNVPQWRTDETVVWTGTEMIIFDGSPLSDGARYNPVTDSWTGVSNLNAPPHRLRASAIWTGSEMIVWGGGYGGFAPIGGRYDPLSDTWRPTSMTGAPTNRMDHAAIWTGTEMIVWGGEDWSHSPPNGGLNTGGRYDPFTDTWTQTSTINAPFAQGPGFAVWTGDMMIGFGGTMTNGGRYRPLTDSWTPTFAAKNWPNPAARPTGVWTGAELIVWNGPAVGDSGRYDPALDVWNAMQRSGAPTAREGETAVWTGHRMVIWGGDANGTPLGTGALYNPTTDAWTGMVASEDTTPAARTGHTAVWTGVEMMVWGGRGAGGPLADGGRYDPGRDLWTLIPSDGAPPPRVNHSAVWTGSEMIVWGGDPGDGVGMNTGGRFDPAGSAGAGAWTATSLAGAPSARSGQTSVWTGTSMIIWGGAQDSSGARYDPLADAWHATSLQDAPAARSGHTAVWTGERMIVWGGSLLTAQTFTPWATGGVYDPASDGWSPTTMSGAPSARFHQIAAWTGSAMLVWGGSFSLGDVAVGDRQIHWYGSVDADPAADLDGDGVASCTDCDDRNPGAWGIPGEVTNLIFGTDAVTLSWSPPASPGAASLTYDLVRSGAADFATDAVCLVTGGTDPTAVDSDTPDVGAVFFYLARARNACPAGTGTLGMDSSGVPRLALVCP